MPPEIGLNGLLLDYPLSGTATYTRNLVRWLPEVAPDFRFRLYVRNATCSPSGMAASRLTTPLAAVNSGAGVGARLDKLAWEVIALPVAAAVRREALLHSLYFAAPILKPTATVVTIHDLVPLVLPGYHRGRQGALYARLMAIAVRDAAAIITVSEHSKKDIVGHLGIPPDRVHVTYEAADERFVPGPPDEHLRSKYGLPQRFVLYMGGAERRKNVETLVKAWALVVSKMRGRGVKLVLVADFPPPDVLYPDVKGMVDSLGLSGDVRFIRRVDEEDKPALYRCALLFCFPSRYEGFGLTPLEAMASGVPTIASTATSVPEVVGDAALLVDPDNEASWGEAMLVLVDSEPQRRELSKHGVARAARFRWRETAEQTATVYRGLLGR